MQSSFNEASAQALSNAPDLRALLDTPGMPALLDAVYELGREFERRLIRENADVRVQIRPPSNVVRLAPYIQAATG